ncbi:MAG: phosphate/phosphite/phosphonate ABC transporter substrate-binding protein, partial [Gemmataceae bacterium]
PPGSAVLLSLPLASLRRAERTSTYSSESNVLRVGAVAYAPSVVTIFQGIKRYLNSKGLASDYVLYSNYDALVRALHQGEVDVAWNTPLAHAQFHVQANGKSKTLVMRDIDRGFQSVLIARKDANVKALEDLKGKTLVLGSRQAAEATVLPKYYLAKQGFTFDNVKLLRLDVKKDWDGCPCYSPASVLQSVVKGYGQTGIISMSLWKRMPKKTKNQLRLIWASPKYSHCVFTAREDLDSKRAKMFTDIMTSMSATDSHTADVMRLEGCKKWLPGQQAGFEDLVKALQQDN